MFPFAMQARLAQTWLDAAATGFAIAGSMGTAAVRNLEPWLPAARPSYAFGFWAPLAQPASVWPWSCFAGFTPPPATSWWQLPLSFYGDWMRAVSYAASSSGYLPAQAWSATFPLPQPYSALLTPFTLTSPADASAVIVASYRTAGGHATAAMFDAFMPRQSHWATAPWRLSLPWMVRS